MDVYPLDVTIGAIAQTSHPHLLLNISSPSLPQESNLSCQTHIHLALPDAIFLDPNDLADTWRPSLTGDAHLLQWSVEPDVVDIERPERCDEPGIKLSAVLRAGAGFLDIPLHARYLRPIQDGSREMTIIGSGGGSLLGGLVCGAGAEEVIHTGRFQPSYIAAYICRRVRAGVLMDADYLHPIVPRVPSTITLPTGKSSHQLPVELSTAAFIWAGWAYLVWKIYRLARRVDRVRDSSYKQKAE